MPKKKKCAECGSTRDLHYCEQCRRWFCYKHIEFGEDPYQSEIHDDHTEVWQCEKCRHEGRRDV